MKLTKSMREIFVRAAMADVPKVDYDQQIQDTLLADAVAQLPEQVQAIWNNPKTQSYLNTSWVYEAGYRYEAPCGEKALKLSAATLKELVRLEKLNTAQGEKLDELRDGLVSLAAGATTREKLIALLPAELHKYVPGQPPAPVDRRVPAVIVDDVMAMLRDAGWPK